MPIAWLERSQAGLVDELSRRLPSRAGSIFRVVGEVVCRQLAETALAALRRDLQAGKREAVRELAQALLRELATKGLNFADLRFFAQTLRTIVHASAEASSDVEADQRRRIDDWMFDLLLVSTMHFMSQREESLQERAAQLEVRQMESQLSELKAAFEEKTQLLELIRQASTPIAPVVDGILVVPLVGVFDAFRAEILTEKLLQSVTTARARVVILDITGVPVFDAEAAQLVIRLAQAVRLLGSEMMLVGVSSEIARTIVELGVDLKGLKTLGTLQTGLAQALAVRRLKIVPL